MNALDLLTGDAQTFLEKVWAAGVHLHEADPGDLVGLLSIEDVDTLLTSVALRTPALRIVRDGAVLSAAEFTRAATIAGQPLSGLVDPRKVLDLYDGGATVVLQGLHRYWEPLTDLVRELELALGHPCQANAYLTPPGAQGFARHEDSHDVIVFQTHGHKHWEIDDAAVVLEPGMAAYLPAGTPHSARSQDVPSLHVTIGINQLTWRSLLSEISTAALADPKYDAALPAGYLDDPRELAERLAGELTGYVARLAGVDARVIADEQAASFLKDRLPLLKGGLVDRTRLVELDADTVLTRRTTATCVVVPEGDRLRVLLGDRELRVPSWLGPSLTHVRDHTSFRPRDLLLDPQSALVLTRRLVREGLLRIGR